LNPISLVYGHDSRKGQQSYRIVAQSTDLAREQLAKVEALITRLGFETRALEATPGYFALWLTAKVRILGKVSVSKVESKKTLVCRMLLLDSSDSNVLNWLQFLNATDPWQVRNDGTLSAPQLPIDNPERPAPASGPSELEIILPWDLIATNSLEIITRWYSGLSTHAQKTACFVAPCLCPLGRIQDFRTNTCLIAERGLSAGPTKIPTTTQPIITKILVIILLSIGLVAGYFTGSIMAPNGPGPSNSEEPVDVNQASQVEVPIFSPEEEEELEVLCAGLRSLATQYNEFIRWNQKLGGRKTALEADLRILNNYLIFAEDAQNPIDERLERLSFAMGEMGKLLERPLEVSSAVDDLLERLEAVKKLTSKIRSSLSWQKERATPDFKADTERMEEAILQIKAALLELRVRANLNEGRQ